MSVVATAPAGTALRNSRSVASRISSTTGAILSGSGAASRRPPSSAARIALAASAKRAISAGSAKRSKPRGSPRSTTVLAVSSASTPPEKR